MAIFVLKRDVKLQLNVESWAECQHSIVDVVIDSRQKGSNGVLMQKMVTLLFL